MVEMRSTYVRSEQGALFLPPGFRFHPTDEEVITSYLLQKFLNPSFTSRAVGEVDLNECEPWDLPSKAKMGEKEWYFFCHKGMKYPTGTRTNRATKEGYWKATGKDKEIFSNKKPSGNLLVGTKKTLVFYMGRAPRGSKTNWVMHEFRLEGNSRDNANLRVDPKDEWVVCKVFHKKGEAKKGGAVDHSAGTTPNVSSVDAGEGDDDFLDSMIDPIYFNNSAGSLPANTTTINAAAPYNADYSISAAAGSSTTGSFVLPNYSLINASSQQFPLANSVPKSGSSNSSWKNMLPAAAGPASGMGTYNNNVGLYQDDHQAVMVKALGGVIGPNSGVSKGLPSSAMAGVPKQQNSLGVPQNKLWGYGHPYSSHLTTRSAATIGSAENLGARLVHY